MDAQGQLHCSDFNVHFYGETIDRVKKHLLARSPPPTGRLRVDVFVNAQTISLLSMKVCVRPQECPLPRPHLRPRDQACRTPRVLHSTLAYGQALGSCQSAPFAFTLPFGSAGVDHDWQVSLRAEGEDAVGRSALVSLAAQRQEPVALPARVG